MNEEIFYYGTTKSGRRAAFCGIKNENKTIRFGIAICNPKDTFNKHLARTISRGRALNERTVDYSRKQIKNMRELAEFAQHQLDLL